MAGAASKLQASTVQTLDDSRAFQGLTSAQHKFIMLVMQGLKPVQAYRAVWDVAHMAETSVYGAAWEMMEKPLVKAKVQELRDRIEAQSTLAPGLTREFVINGVMHLAVHATKESVQLGAYQTLGKTVGIDLFREVHVTEKRVRTVEDVEQELKQRLAELQAQLTTVEGEARRVDPPAASSAPARDRRRKPANKNPAG